jgi:hypothetical protein
MDGSCLQLPVCGRRIRRGGPSSRLIYPKYLDTSCFHVDLSAKKAPQSARSAAEDRLRDPIKAIK